MTTAWDDLPEYEVDRILALPFEDMIRAMFDHAPKASSADVMSVLGNEYKKADIKRVRDAWAAERKGKSADEPFVPEVPTREAVIAELKKAIESGDSRAAERWARSLVALGRAGDLDPAQESTEEWDRLSDLEAGVMVALVRKLNGEPLTDADGQWLSHLR